MQIILITIEISVIIIIIMKLYQPALRNRKAIIIHHKYFALRKKKCKQKGMSVKINKGRNFNITIFIQKLKVQLRRSQKQKIPQYRKIISWLNQYGACLIRPTRLPRIIKYINKLQQSLGFTKKNYIYSPQLQLESYSLISLYITIAKKTNRFFCAYEFLQSDFFEDGNYQMALNILYKCKEQFLGSYHQCIISLEIGINNFFLKMYQQSIKYLMQSKQILQLISKSFKHEYLSQMIYFYLGIAHRQMNKIPQTIYYIKQSLQFHPQLNNEDINSIQFIVYQNQEDSQPPSISTTNVNDQMAKNRSLAQQYLQQQRYPQTIQCCLQMIRLDESYIDPYLILQECFLEQKDYKKSLWYCNKAIQINPQSSKAICGLGKIKYCLNQYECAIHHHIQSIKVDFNLQSFVNISLIYYYHSNHRQLIIQQLNKLQKSAYSNFTVRLHFAIAFKLIGYPQKYYSYFNHLTQPIQKDIMVQNYFLIIAFNRLKEVSKRQQFQSSVTLDLLILCGLLKYQIQSAVYYQRSLNYHQQAHKNLFQTFVSIYEEKVCCEGEHYKILLCYFFIRQMFKQNKDHALKSVIWVLNKQPSIYYFPGFTHLVNQYEQVNRKYAFQAYQFVSHLVKKLMQESIFTFQKHIQEKVIQKEDISILSIFKIKLIESLKKCMNHSKKYIKFMVNLKKDKIAFQLNKLIDFSTEAILQKQSNQSIFETDKHQQFILDFERISVKQQKMSFALLYTLKYLLKLQLVKFVYQLLAHYVQFRQKCLKQFVNALKEIKQSDLFDIDKVQGIFDKIMNKSEGENSKMQTISYRYNLVSHQRSIKTNTSISQSDFIERVVQQGIFYSKIISLENIEFGLNSPKFEAFRKLMLKNSYLLPQYLFHQYCKPKNIVKFFIERQWNQKAPQFQLLMEKGQQIKIQQDYVCEQRNRFYSWIIGIAKAIAEIETMGIFHADIEFKNTIAIKQGNQLIFKLIDFGRAFKVRLVKAETKQLKIYQNTMQMMENMLHLACANQDYSIIQFMFKPIDEGSSKEQIQSLANKLILLQPQQCLQQLWKHSQRSHLFSYCRLVQTLLKCAENAADVIISTEQLSEMRQKINNLREGKIGWNQFIKHVQDVKDKYD